MFHRSPKQGVDSPTTNGERNVVIITSINTSKGQGLQLNDKPVPTGIVKTPETGPISISPAGVGSDHIEDLAVHGGDDQAVYCYGVEDYEWWSQELGREIPPGTFGENLTISGFNGHDWSVGDLLVCGEGEERVEMIITAPRVPCFKLGLRMEDPGFVKRFADAARPGAYGRVIKSGRLSVGDTATVTPTTDPTVTLRDISIEWHENPHSKPMIQRILATPVAKVHRGRFEQWLAAL